MLQRILYLDYIKTIAMTMVIVYHCKIIEFFTPLATITHMGVPLFIAVNGALLLTKERQTSYFLRKTFKILVIIAIWGVISTCSEMFYRGDEFSLIAIAKHIKELDLYYCNYLWFMVALFSLLLLCPIIQRFLDTPDRVKYIAVITLVCPFVLRYASKLNPITFYGNILIFYYFWGGYLILFKKKIGNINRWHIIATIVLCIVAYSICADNIESFKKLTGKAYYNIIVAIATLGVLELLRRVKWKENQVVNYISHNTLGIYLLQGPIYRGLQCYIPWIQDLSIIFPLIVMILCMAIIWVLNKNKYTSYIISL